MNIELQVISPQAQTVGIDGVISKLTLVDELIAKISETKPIKISFGSEGADLSKVARDVQAMSAGVEQLTVALRAAGNVDLASKLEKGIASFSDVAGIAGSNVAKLRGEFTGLNQKASDAAAHFDALNKTDYIPQGGWARARKELEALQAQAKSSQIALEQMVRVEGMAAALAARSPSGTGGNAIPYVNGEKAASAAMRESTTALQAQEQAASKKIGTMANLTRETQKVAEADRTGAAAAREAAAGHGLLAQKVKSVKGKEGDPELLFQTGPGQTRRVSAGGDVVTDEIRHMEVFQNRLRALDERFSEQRKEMPNRSRDYYQSLKTQAEEMRGLVGSMAEVGLRETPLGQRMVTRSNVMDRTANTGIMGVERTERMAEQASRVARYRTELDELNKSHRQRISQIEREYSASKAAATGDDEQMAAMRRRAEQYDALLRERRALGRGGDSLTNALEGKSAVANASVIAGGRSEGERMAMERRAAANREQFLERSSDFGDPKRVQTTTREDGSSQRVTSYSRDVNGQRETVRLTEELSAKQKLLSASSTSLTEKLAETGRNAAGVGRSFFTNLAHISAWSASVGVLYKSLEMVKFAGDSMIKIQYDTARLQTVFRGAGGTAADMRDEVMKLAVANGRGADEAMEASVQWSRFGLTQRETLEAVDVSLKAATVAEISSGVATQRLSSIYAAYGLEIGELRTVLGELNAISNTYNVTNKDMLDGVSRSASVAKQAGLSFTELIALVGAGVARTGRSGSEIGNTIKALIVSLNNPTMQKFLGKSFNFEVKTPTGNIKEMSQILDELYVKYEAMTRSDKGELLGKLGGKQQASRLGSILDGYITSQMLAIRAQENLNSVDKESINLRQTVSSQLSSLSTQFQRLSVNMGTAGGDVSILKTLERATELLQNLVGLGAEFPTVFMMILSVIVAMGVRLAVTVATMDDGSKKASFFANTIRQVKLAYDELGVAIDKVNAKSRIPFASAAGGATSAGREMLIAPGVARSAGDAVGKEMGMAATKSLGQTLKGLGGVLIGTIFSEGMLAAVAIGLALEGVMVGLNYLFEKSNGDVNAAKDKLKVYNEELEKTKALAESLGRRERLAGTLGKVIENGLVKSDPTKARQAIEDFSSIAHPGSTPEDAEKQRQVKAEMLAMLGSETGQHQLISRLQQYQAQWAKEKIEQQRSAVRLRQQELQFQNESLKKLDEEIALRKRGGNGTSKLEGDRQTLLNQISGKTGEYAKAIDDVTDTQESADKDSPSAKMAKAKVKQVASVVDELFKNMPQTDDPVERLNRERQAIDAKIKSMEEMVSVEKRARDAEVGIASKRVDAIEQEKESVADLYAAREAMIKKVDEAESASRKAQLDVKLRMRQIPVESISLAASDNNRLTGSGAYYESRAKSAADSVLAAKNELETFDRKNQSLVELAQRLEEAKKTEQTTKDIGDERVRQIGLQVTARQEELEEARKLLDADRERAAMMEKAQNEGKRAGKLVGLDSTVGRTEGERGVRETNKMLSMADRLTSQEEMVGKGVVVRSKRDAVYDQNMLLEVQRRLEEQILSLKERQIKLGAEIKNAKADETREIQRQEQEEGKRFASYSGAGYHSGANETEKALNSLRAIGPGPTGIGQLSNAMSSLNYAKDADKPREEGRVMGLIETQIRNIHNVEERRKKLQAEIVDLKRQEVKEAGQALLMADRESQLRAALLAKQVATNGAVGAGQFQYMSQDTKQAAQRFVPGALPAEYETRTRAAQNELRLTSSVSDVALSKFTKELEVMLRNVRDNQSVNPVRSVQLTNEQKVISDKFGGLESDIKDLSTRISAIPKAVPMPQVPGGVMPTVNVALSFGDQFKQILATVNEAVRAPLQQQITTMQADFRAFMSAGRIGAVQASAGGYG